MQGVCAVVCLGMPVFGQSGLGTGLGTGAVKRARLPYTAKFKITSVQTLANGTTITRESIETLAKDSEGRRLTVNVTPATERVPERTSFHVFDPVARTNINWTVPGESATVQPMPPHQTRQTGSTCWTTGVPQETVSAPSERPTGTATTLIEIGGGSIGESLPARPGAFDDETVQEDLGTQTIQGVVARGTRTTHTIPIGAIGNDAPLVRTMEVWTAQPLGLAVRQVTDDPRMGKRTRELTELSQSEPDAATFQPPEGYEIVTEELHEVPCAH
jgi:hypothetical protein